MVGGGVNNMVLCLRASLELRNSRAVHLKCFMHVFCDALQEKFTRETDRGIHGL